MAYLQDDRKLSRIDAAGSNLRLGRQIMLQIDRIELHEIVLPLIEPFRISSATFSNRRILLLYLVSAEGAESWSECVGSGETIDASWRTLGERIAPQVLGRPLSGPGEIDTFLDGAPGWRAGRGPAAAAAAVEMGVWELAAKLSGTATSLSSPPRGCRAKRGSRAAAPGLR
jgi:L-alanine-DL-glutamate epimerase-like enolase superfamily enzyme